MGTPAAPAEGGTGTGTGFPLPSELVPGNGQAPPPQQQAPAAPPAPAPETAPDPATELRAALNEERRRHRETMQALSQLQQQGMTSQERAIAEAKAAGKSEAVREAGLRVAAAEFRALAAGKLADPGAALELLDLSKFVGEDGEVDKDGLTAMVDKLAKQVLGATGKQIPAGPMGDAAPDDGDFLRTALRRKQGTPG